MVEKHLEYQLFCWHLVHDGGLNSSDEKLPSKHLQASEEGNCLHMQQQTSTTGNCGPSLG